MADAIWTANEQRICDIGCGWTRCALLSIEPGARLWLEVDGTPLLFERAQDDEQGRSVRRVFPVGESVELWRSLFTGPEVRLIEIELTERPADKGRSADRWCDREEAA